MKQTLISTALALGLGFLSTPSFAGSYIVNGHAASPAEARTWAPAVPSKVLGC